MKWLAASAVVCLCASIARADTVLVLPFFNASGQENLSWVSESISEFTGEALAAHGVIVLTRDDRQEAYRRLSIKANSLLTTASVLRIADSLDADHVIHGSFEVTRGALRITGHLIDRRKLVQGPVLSAAGPVEDLARLQTEIGWQSLGALLKGAVPEEEFRRRQKPLRIEAIESYVRGLMAASPDQKLRLFSQAVRLEPKYSEANLALGKLYVQRRTYRAAVDFLSSVAEDHPHYREALFLLGLGRYHLGEFGLAEKAFRKVAESVPLNEVLNNLGAAQSRLGSPEALESFRKALEGDSNDPDYIFNVGFALLRRGEYEEAIEQFRAVLDRRPDDAEATIMLGRSIKKQKSPRSGPAAGAGSERIKTSYEESAYLQLKAVLDSKR